LICCDLEGKDRHVEEMWSKCASSLWTSWWFFIILFIVWKVDDICAKDIIVGSHPSLRLGKYQVFDLFIFGQFASQKRFILATFEAGQEVFLWLYFCASHSYASSTLSTWSFFNSWEKHL